LQLEILIVIVIVAAFFFGKVIVVVIVIVDQISDQNAITITRKLNLFNSFMYGFFLTYESKAYLY
jgi:hypothetical protein